MELLRRTRQHMEEAVKEKIFMVQGTYPIICNVLQARGWVEKFSSTVRVGARLGQQQDTWNLLDEDDEGDSGDEQWEAPPEEDAHWYDEDLDGIHDIMVGDEDQGWCNDVNFRLLQDHQVVNHFNGIRAFTIKVRACRHQGRGAVVPVTFATLTSCGLQVTYGYQASCGAQAGGQNHSAPTAQVQPPPPGQLRSFFSSGSVPQAPPLPNPPLPRAQVALPQCGTSALPKAPLHQPQSHQGTCVHALGSRAMLQAGGTQQRLGAGRRAAMLKAMKEVTAS
uniref:Uncharacterized protein n=1 Tax=Amazona collaria TaxID=241587 RepID=A0A8B9F7N7_9PSIT